MTIGSIGSSIATQQTFDISALSSTGSTAPSSGTFSVSAGDSRSMSGPGQLMNKLKELQQSDPAKFKEVMNKLSDKLSDEAKSASDPKQQKMLTDMAAKFKQAGETGDLSVLRPPGGAGHAHRHPSGPPPQGGAQAASGTDSKSAVQDPADTNGDGTVSDQEKQAYQAKQAASGGSDAARAYQRQSHAAERENMRAVFDGLSSIVDEALAGTTSAQA